MPHALVVDVANDHEALKRFQKDRAVLEIPQREFRDDTLMHAHLIALEQIDQNRPHPRRPTRLQVLRQVPVPQDRLRRLRTAVRPQDLALGHPEPGRRVGVSDDQAVDSLQSTGARRRPSTLRAAIEKLLTESPTQLAFHIPDFLAVLEGGCTLTDGRLGFVFITSEAVTLVLPQRWSPVMRPGELAATGRC